ncbi:MFS transporter [Actinoplanes sp. M2I2]|uniref:MFS transporter n=1 Tax=Actinoplanes sp. M2I2 TaxID=1734444 RepID=UPI0020209784|nr:MFS transporter [Actinoplanes sp. M2I2]
MTAVAVSTIYLPQPLLTDFISQLGASTAGASSIATAVQLGYALGIFLFVPLADHFQPRSQITLQMALLAAGLVTTAALPATGSVAAGFFVVGLVANIAQLIIPTAAKLAPADAKHSTTSVLVGSLLIGIFGGRIVAGLLGALIGWRGVLLLFALFVVLCLPLIRRVIPNDLPVADRIAYHRILLSTVRRLGTSRVLLESAIMQFFGFAAFNAVWTVMVLHLTGPSVHWSVAAAGLFGLVGIAAGVVTLVAARAVQRWGSRRAVTTAIVVLIAALSSATVDNRLIWLFAPSVFLLTWANQVLQSANQSRVLLANPGSAAQANTMFMTAVFLGGSLGAALGSIAFDRDGMTGVGEIGVVLAALAGVVWLTSSLWDRRAAGRGPSMSVSPVV